MKNTPSKVSFCLILFICLSLFPAAFTGMGGAADNKPVSPFEIDKLEKAPEFTLQDLNGSQVPSSTFKGKVVLLNFWATWCPSCIAELPSLNSLSKDKGLKAKGFEVVAVSTDASAPAVKDFLRKKGLAMRVLMDERKSVTKQFKVFSLPTTFLIDRQGRIVEKFFGEYDWTDKEIMDKIGRLL